MPDKEFTMDWSSQFRRFDNAFNRFYARKAWLVWLILLSPGLGSVAMAAFGPPAGGVTLIIHSKLDRPILGFSVNGVAGGNAWAHNPDNKYAGENGKSTCCGRITGKTAEVIWTLDVTGAQYDAGMRPEQRRVVIPMPERKRGENDLHVHFLPGDNVVLGWSDNAFSPYSPRSPHYRPLPDPEKTAR